MKFIYFYSPFYVFFHNQIQYKLSPYFTCVPLLINDILENKDSNIHHFNGLTIKLELIIEQIQKEFGSTIIFSDATVFINETTCMLLESFINNYIDYDICFIKENDIFNIGFMKINCNDNTISFFKNCLNIMKNGEYSHDQGAVNYLLPNSGLKYTTFDENIIYCDSFDASKNNYIIYKSFIKNVNKINNFNQRIQNFYDNKLIDENTYNDNYIKEKEGFSHINDIPIIFMYIINYINYIIFLIIILFVLNNTSYFYKYNKINILTAILLISIFYVKYKSENKVDYKLINVFDINDLQNNQDSLYINNFKYFFE
jgi:hypothetical protein